MTINLFRRLQNLQPEAPVLYATLVVRLGAMARVEFPGGGTSIVNNPLEIEAGAPVFVRGGAVTGPAPDLVYTRIDV
ncbi:hypothetical protein [Delftia acidovorans]|uniref:hypothetical protein n=1 Tax=Delftia acidovorans TaxID=80866 RepID=UPI00192C0455|nr:hypothetical protein [Delftia acidovorans]